MLRLKEILAAAHLSSFFFPILDPPQTILVMLEWAKTPLAVFSAALVVRLALVVYGTWQDANMVVKYTDIDYEVVHDAARYMVDGGTPYDRATYRYTPLLAAMLVPNFVFGTKLWGKFLFCIFDLSIGYFIYHIAALSIKPRCAEPKQENSWPLIAAAVWLFNPIAVNVSTRGNSEAIVGSLVLASLYLLMRKQEVLSAIVFAVAIHFKIYPIIFSVAIFFYIDRETPFKQVWNSRILGVVEQFFRWRRIRYAVVTVVVLAALTWSFYQLYGWTFLYETYLYHIVRKDHRHNFSVYFYQMYLSSAPHTAFTAASAGFTTFGMIVDVAERVGAFLPQLVSLGALTARFAQRDLPFALFGMTIAFVAFNKVCTVQYFIWYFSLLPLVLARTTLSIREAAVMFGLWAGAQALWLFSAYLLEFQGINTFIWIWLAGLAFFAAHIGSLCAFVKRHTE